MLNSESNQAGGRNRYERAPHSSFTDRPHFDVDATLVEKFNIQEIRDPAIQDTLRRRKKNSNAQRSLLATDVPVTTRKGSRKNAHAVPAVATDTTLQNAEDETVAEQSMAAQNAASEDAGTSNSDQVLEPEQS